MGFFAELRRRHVIKIAIVYVTVGFAVLQGADLLLPTLSVPDWSFRLMVAGVLLGFPIALVLAWALEVTPDGIERVGSSAAIREAEPEPAAAGLSSTAAAVATVREVSERSVAVLPFANLSDAADNEYFTDGITEEILTVLSKVRSLEVISRTSVMRYKGTAQGIVEIAEELRVAHVVEGSVRWHGERVRITAQLIDARTDRHLWAETYDRDLDDVFAIQSDVAERIVGSLKGALTPAERERIESRPTDSVEAYQWFLKGRQLLAQRTSDSLRRAVEAFDRAIAADPAFALAWALRAQALLIRYDLRWERVAEARESARRALELQGDLAEAHAALGLAAHSARQWDEADREFRRALELEPGLTSALHWYAMQQATLGRFDDAIATLRRALELDPLSLPLHLMMGSILYRAGRVEEAERVYRRGLEIEPRSPLLHVNLSVLYESQDRYPEAIEETEISDRLQDRSQDLIAEIRRGWEERGERGYWEATLEAYRSRPDLPERILCMALALARLGRLDEAVDALEPTIEDPFYASVHVDPQLAMLRTHPRFASLVERMGLGEAMRAAESSRSRPQPA